MMGREKEAGQDKHGPNKRHVFVFLFVIVFAFVCMLKIINK